MKQRHATHSIPRFNGADSRVHHAVPVGKLRRRAAWHGLLHHRRLSRVDTLVHFAGFPRSGHSLIGSIIDAHRNARVAHELDDLGLLEHDMSMHHIIALMDHAAHEFTRHGRSWNGYRYFVDGAHHEAGNRLKVIGDKKGDLAVRRIQQDPALLDRLVEGAGHRRLAWIGVTRHPLDNIATMSLRAGRVYDTLRARALDTADFHAQLAAAQARGEIASEVLDEQIDAYSALCETVQTIRDRTPATDWHTLCHERLAEEPSLVLGELMRFLGLAVDADHIARSAAMIHTRPARSRALLDWPERAKRRVLALTERHAFLGTYRDSTLAFLSA